MKSPHVKIEKYSFWKFQAVESFWKVSQFYKLQWKLKKFSYFAGQVVQQLLKDAGPPQNLLDLGHQTSVSGEHWIKV